jgi:ribose 5-phosphate isomerase B
MSLIPIGCDHAGYEAKERLRTWLQEKGHETLDMGAHSLDSVDYPDFAEKVARYVAEHPGTRGILICGTGIGIGIAANKVAGIRAAGCHDELTARLSRCHNDANICCLGARITALSRMESIVEVFLGTAFEGGRHEPRIAKIDRIEPRIG